MLDHLERVAELRERWRGPEVRLCALEGCDHDHGHGEGRFRAKRWWQIYCCASHRQQGYYVRESRQQAERLGEIAGRAVAAALWDDD